MAVFDTTEPLVMMPLCSAFTPADKTDALAAGNIAKMSFHQWVGTNVALRCCRMNMPSAGRAKFADCNAHEDKKFISKQLSKLCVPKLRRAAQGKGNCSRMTTRNCSRKTAWNGRNGQCLKFIHIQFELELNADTAHDENELELRREGAASRALPTISSGGVWFSEPYEEVDVVGQRKSFTTTPVTLLGQVSP